MEATTAVAPPKSADPGLCHQQHRSKEHRWESPLNRAFPARHWHLLTPKRISYQNRNLEPSFDILILSYILHHLFNFFHF